ncbi:MAG: hypothetical protein PHT49_07950 [Desulfovibrionales bacterium]|nr:hypothetical protein [Desulfovibrionales bacterium]
MKKICQLDRMIASQIFRFDRLVLKDIDNTTVFKVFGHEALDQETCLFHQNVSYGDHYLDMLHKLIEQGVLHKKGVPVVRFADGEYAFYNYTLGCNGLYQQAESVWAIKKAMPSHLEALKTLAGLGKFAPLIFPENMHQETKGFLSFLRNSKQGSSASTFVNFLYQNHIELTGDNYLPFYVVYAYLTSEDFARLVNRKKVCILSSECNMDSCIQWFERFSSCPEIVFTELPDSYVATRWPEMKKNILRRIPSDTNICLVGAGVGALLVCVDVAQRFAIPAIDAGHVLNMMNSREDKSRGPRLYTIRKPGSSDDRERSV